MTEEIALMAGTTSQELNDVINTQLTLLTTIQEIDCAIYDQLDEDKIRVMSNAFQVILVMQEKLKELV